MLLLLQLLLLLCVLLLHPLCNPNHTHLVCSDTLAQTGPMQQLGHTQLGPASLAAQCGQGGPGWLVVAAARALSSPAAAAARPT